MSSGAAANAMIKASDPTNMRRAGKYSTGSTARRPGQRSKVGILREAARTGNDL